MLLISKGGKYETFASFVEMPSYAIFALPQNTVPIFLNMFRHILYSAQVEKMVDIEWYINTDKGKVLSNQQVCGSIQHFVRDVFIGLSDEEKVMKELLERIATQYNVELGIYDVKQRGHSYRAFFKGVRETPTLIIGREKLIGEATEERIIKILEDQMDSANNG